MKRPFDFFWICIIFIIMLGCNNPVSDNDDNENNNNNYNVVQTVSGSRGGHLYTSNIKDFSEIGSPKNITRNVKYSYENYSVDVLKDDEPFILDGKLVIFEANDILIEGTEYIVRYIKIDSSWIVFILKPTKEDIPDYHDYKASISGGALKFEGAQPNDTKLWEFTQLLDNMEVGKTLQEIVNLYLDFGYIPTEVPYGGDYLSCAPFRNYTTVEGVVLSDIDFGYYLCWGQTQTGIVDTPDIPDVKGGALKFNGFPDDPRLWSFTELLDNIGPGKTLQEIVNIYLDFGYVPAEVPYDGDYLSCAPFRNYTTVEGIVLSDIDFGYYLCWGQTPIVVDNNPGYVPDVSGGALKFNGSPDDPRLWSFTELLDNIGPGKTLQEIVNIYLDFGYVPAEVPYDGDYLSCAPFRNYTTVEGVVLSDIDFGYYLCWGQSPIVVDNNPGYVPDAKGGALKFNGSSDDPGLWSFTELLDNIGPGKTLQEIVNIYLDFGYVPAEVPYDGDYLSCAPFRNYTTVEGIVLSDIDFGYHLCWGQTQTGIVDTPDLSDVTIIGTVETEYTHRPVIMRVDWTNFQETDTPIIRIYNIFWKNISDGDASVTYRYNINEIDHYIGSEIDINALDEIARDLISDTAVINFLKTVNGDITLIVDGTMVSFTYYFYGHR